MFLRTVYVLWVDLAYCSWLWVFTALLPHALVTFYLRILLEMNLAFTNDAGINIPVHVSSWICMTGSLGYVLRMNNTKLFIVLSERGNTSVSRLRGFFPLITSMHLILASFYYCQCYWHKIGSSYYLLAFLWLIVRLNISAFFSKPFVYPSFWSSESFFGPNVSVPPEFLCWTLIPHAMVLEGGDWGR